MRKNHLEFITLVVLFLTTACSVNDSNPNKAEQTSLQDDSTSSEFAVMSSQISADKNQDPEYCFLGLKGMSEEDLQDENFQKVVDVFPIFEKSLTAKGTSLLESAQLRRSVGLSRDIFQQQSIAELKSELKQISIVEKSKGHDCLKTARILKGHLGLVPEAERSLEFGWGIGAAFCVWACAVVSQPPPDHWPTRSAPGTVTLPEFPSKTQYRPFRPGLLRK